LGFSTVDKLVFSGSITQPNIFGSGKFVSLQINTGKVNTVYAMSYLNPYFTIDGISQGFDVYMREVDSSSLSVGSYKTETLGGGIKFGYPITESDSISVGLVAEDVSLTTDASSPVQYIDFVNQFGSNYTYLTGMMGWARDRRDSAIQPSRGTLARASGELAAGDLEYYRLNASYQWYWSMTRNVTLMLNGELGYAEGIGGKPLPFFKNFYGGGPGSVRGFKAASLGPQDISGNVLGGNRKVVGNAEVMFPVPGAGSDKSMRLSAFVDSGWVYGASDKLDLGELRYSAGLAFFWVSPFGPLKVSAAQPLNEKKGFDRIERVQLTFGSAF
jgi:outer membrane protein insertion porin family